MGAHRQVCVIVGGTMSDSALDILKAPPTKAHRGPGCEYHKWLAKQSDEIRDAAKALMANDDYEHADIARRLGQCGLKITPQSLGRTRNGGCQCENDG